MLSGCYRHLHKSRQLQRIWASTWLTKGSARSSSTLADLHSELTSRRLPLLFDTPTLTQSNLLGVTLSDFLPPSKVPLFEGFTSIAGGGRPSPFGRSVPLGHHLIYFPPTSRLSTLLPDGTDPSQSPGEPFVRRMWAGGHLNFRPNNSPRLIMNGQLAFCLERIKDMTVKGIPKNEKIFLNIERRVSTVRTKNSKGRAYLETDTEDDIRHGLLNDENCSIIEHRNIVFMRDQSFTAAANVQKSAGRVMKPQHEPTFSHVLVPTAALLFRFSALTFNAHKIHLDKQYCLDMEGHRNLLVHGPLSLVLMIELLRRHIKKQVDVKEHINEIDYRNVAPLYADEPMKVCGRATGKGKWDVWIEGRDGRYAVKGTVKTGLEQGAEKRITPRGSTPASEDTRYTSREPNSTINDPEHAPKHTLEDPEELEKMPLAS